MWHRHGFRTVAKYMISRGIHVVLVGAKSDKEVCAEVAQGLDVLDLSGKTGISEVMYVMKNAAIAICNDSMSLHMASAFKVPNVAVFCATSPEFGYGPWKNNAIVVEKEGLSCKPCRSHGSNKCPTGTEACMRDLSPEKVIDAARTLLDVK